MKFLCSLLFFALTFFAHSGFAQDCVLQMKIQGTIGPATLDYVERGLKQGTSWKCSSVFLEINTPGGNLQTTRRLVEIIMGSTQPFLCLITPSGGHAGSAGAILMQACHLNGAMEATNIGAATPISSMGEDLYKDLRKKMVEDTQSWVESLARHYGRNAELAGKLVSEAKSLEARSAYEQKLIDQVVYRHQDFLSFAEGKEVKLAAETKILQLGALKEFPLDLRFQVLDLVTDPQWSYLMFMGSLGLLYFEITHPGMIVPGVVGGIGLIVSLISFHKLDVFWGGFALLILGLALLVAEVFVSSFGLLGIGGVISFVLGSLFLYDFQETGFHLPILLVFTTAMIFAGLILGLSYMALKTFRLPVRQGGTSILVGAMAIVKELEEESSQRGWVEIKGEVWKFESDRAVQMGDSVEVYDSKGLVLFVR